MPYIRPLKKSVVYHITKKIYLKLFKVLLDKRCICYVFLCIYVIQRYQDLYFICIQDKNDSPPTFDGTPYSFTVREDAAIGMSIGQLQATDADNPVRFYSVSLIPQTDG